MTAKQEREAFKKECARVIEIVTSKRAYDLVEESLDEVAQERAEIIVNKQLPGLKEMFDQISDSAPENFLNDVLDNEANEIVEDLIEMKKRCFMPYNRLDIRCNRREIDFEKVDYLLDN